MIENPFLSPDEPAELACVTDPFSTEGVVLTVEDPLDAIWQLRHNSGIGTPAQPANNVPIEASQNPVAKRSHLWHTF